MCVCICHIDRCSYLNRVVLSERSGLETRKIKVQLDMKQA